MGPETATQVTPANLEMTRNRVEIGTGNFARAYARGSHMFAWLRDRVTGRPDEARLAAAELQPSLLRLAEYEGRTSVVPGTIGVDDFRLQVAVGAANSFQTSQDEVITAATEAVQTPGAWTGLSRVWSGPEGDAVKILTTGALAGLYFIGGPNAANADVLAHAALASGAIATMDVGRRLILETTSRIADLPARTAELIRRKASISEGTITGDIFPAYFAQPEPGEIISNELENRQAASLHEALNAYDIQRPPLATHDEPWTTNLRNVIEGSLRPFDQLQETIRSRDIAVRSRLLRTLVAAGIIAGTIGHFIATRPAQLEVPGGNCPITAFPDPNLRTQDSVERNDVAHFSGIAWNILFRRMYGVNYDHSQKHTELMNKLRTEDFEGTGKIAEEIANELRRTNPQLRMVTTDLFKTRDAAERPVYMVNICTPQEEDAVVRRAVERVKSQQAAR